jgi:SAM-dependent methyltransferase
MNLEELQWNWNQFGKVDPLFAILTNSDKEDHRWNKDEFFNTGENEVKAAIDCIGSLNHKLAFGCALDFGCGVGRLTQALCRYFESCDGVDIASSMIELARRFNKYGERCRYHVNIDDNLRLFRNDSFDFIYSMIVLQHIEPRYSTQYVREFIRVLKPGGIAIFQIPSEILISEILISDNEPLAAGAYKADINVIEPPATLICNARAEIKVHLQNVSEYTWPGANGCFLKHPIRLGNHWLRPDGSAVVWDDGRTPLERDLPTAEGTTLKLTVKSPADPGEYVLELDVVQERVAWFGQKGSKTVRLPVRNISDSSPVSANSKPTKSEPLPRAEMHCIPRDVVVELIRSNGASIVYIREDFMARPAYSGFNYCITK